MLFIVVTCMFIIILFFFFCTIFCWIRMKNILHVQHTVKAIHFSSNCMYNFFFLTMVPGCHRYVGLLSLGFTCKCLSKSLLIKVLWKHWIIAKEPAKRGRETDEAAEHLAVGCWINIYQASWPKCYVVSKLGWVNHKTDMEHPILVTRFKRR